MSERPLFRSKSNAEIAELLSHPEALAAVFLLTGFRDVWSDAVIELSDLFESFQKEGRDAECLWLVFDELWHRTRFMDGIKGCLDGEMEMAARFGFDPYPARRRQNERAKDDKREETNAARQARWDAQARAATMNTRAGKQPPAEREGE